MFKVGLVLIFSIATVSCVQFGQKETSSALSIEAIKSRAPASVDPAYFYNGILVKGDEVLLNQREAITVCENRGMRLPTILELVRLRKLETEETDGIRRDLISIGYKPIVAQEFNNPRKKESFYYKINYNIPDIFAEVGNKTFWSSSVNPSDPNEGYGLNVQDGWVIKPKISMRTNEALCIRKDQSANSNNSDGSDISSCKDKLEKMALVAFDATKFRVADKPTTAKADMDPKYKEVTIFQDNSKYIVTYQLKNGDIKICEIEGATKITQGSD